LLLRLQINEFDGLHIFLKLRRYFFSSL